MKFASEGFDLDAMDSASRNDNQNVIYEIGGGVSQIEINPDKTKNMEQDKKEGKEIDPVLEKAESLKQQGNEAFKQSNWLEAYDMYTEAIEATPGPITGKELLQQRDEWRRNEHLRARRALARQEEINRQQRKAKKDKEQADKKHNDGIESQSTSMEKADGNVLNEGSDEAESSSLSKEEEPVEFQAPPHPHAEALSVYHSNRSATLVQLERYEEAISDCDIALLLNPVYVKALVRRAKASEAMEKYEEAILDLKRAIQLESNVKNQKQYKTSLRRVEKLEAERMEKLKAETMDKLKDLGNSILGNFGLSLDNFKAVQDPNTGSYSISFDNNAK